MRVINLLLKLRRSSISDAAVLTHEGGLTAFDSMMGRKALGSIVLSLLSVCVVSIHGEAFARTSGSPTCFYPTSVVCGGLPGSFQLNRSTAILVGHEGEKNAEFLRDEIEKACGLRLSVRRTQGGLQKPNAISLLLANKKVDVPEPAKEILWNKEAYYLSANDDYVLITGSDLRGQFYGLITLLQLIDPETRAIAQVEVSDWPKMVFRGLRGHFPKNTPEEIENFKRIIRAMAFCRLNQLWIRDLYVRRFPASVRWDSHPEISDEDALPKAVVKELIDYAARYNVKIMGSLASTADNIWSIYPHLIEMDANESPFTVNVKAEKEKGRTSRYRFGSRFNFCPSKEETYKLLFDLIEEMAPLFSSEVFDLGIDEVDQPYNGSRWVACALCKGKDPVKLFADFINRLADHVTARGKTPLINSSSFIKGHAGDFHDIYKSVSLIRKNIIINNWSEKHIRATDWGFFNHLSKFKSTEYFRQYGLERMVHLVGYERRWKDRPELLETKGFLDCYGACVTHYKYMTDGQFGIKPTIDDMTFSGSHFWKPNDPEIGSEREETHLSYARCVVQGILQGKTFLHAISDARSRHQIAVK